ncbi:MAG TPA: serine/threonine protein kinase, partial [Nannocystis exedens]|nr:serine/threonine protein kinase [Nannocystis exedens]
MTNTPPVTPPASRVVEAPSRIPPSPQGSTPRSATFENRFRVIDRLASGGSAIVYLCEDLTLRSRAAVKVLNTADPEMRQRFSEEATLLANVRHPHLVQVLSAGECKDGSPYIAMEDLGENLDRRLREGGPLPWREVVQVALQVADALQALHRAGIVHRDVKPSNIAQVQGEEGQLFVKLIDLGIACAEDLASLQQGGPELPTR